MKKQLHENKNAHSDWFQPKIFFELLKRFGVLCMFKALSAHKGLKSPKRFINLPFGSMPSIREHVKNIKFWSNPKYFSFLFIHDLLFSPGHLLESKQRFVNLFGDFSPLCGVAPIIYSNLLKGLNGPSAHWVCCTKDYFRKVHRERDWYQLGFEF